MPTPHPIGVTRRELLQVGYSGLLGVGLSSFARAGSSGTTPAKKPKSLLIVFLTGAASHHETFDPKPDAPPEIRGEYQTIRTRTPGLLASEHLPKLAARSNLYSVIRSLAHRENNHLVATHHVLTGNVQPGAFFDKIASRDDFPNYAAGRSYFRGAPEGTPCGVNLPTYLMEGPLLWPGQHAGFLGPKHDVMQITQDPNRRDFRVDNLRPSAGMEVNDLRDRMALLSAVNDQRKWLAEAGETKKLTDQQHQALSVLTSGKVARAFDLDQEPAGVRDRYGRHAFGQSCLLARRLIEAGVPVVQANMGRVQNWDSHGNIFNRLKKDLLPPLDTAVSALLDDMTARGLLDDTLVMMLGEFGREPKINKEVGREHWAPCFSGLFAGAGVVPGTVIGKSDKNGAYPVTAPYSPDDIGATVYSVLGVDPHADVRDRLNRPVQLNRGQVIRPLFDGSAD
ncbi:hypothetical protein GobsT_38880 [Gemmata obscuriglobus]|uniref:DUF1501 domain-containing protein n=1 Tax=Gemmata obscuriglobus TaxID=114 RepID=A0A2Z3H129_9BACT|nr:DUF1501 domain-containing protein [Gemmata obscuriglobus]AWM38032.1 DUF1501 domain-containing protein [Gemmata obscuriglobus]QEG29099.1 hypothetical protein GobsT_38880 [Gemmata obscuriglobus]VTS07773.1 hypothetical protein : Uncharacterized protein OS=Isosphaera pallida (strain ATCC 43644 / DSM 9630 / IS1B) GN=Isop_0759 PE=4 SV=1: DUF1501 [Gemmata obscuriglobus UQM 2246]